MGGETDANVFILFALVYLVLREMQYNLSSISQSHTTLSPLKIFDHEIISTYCPTSDNTVPQKKT